MTIDADKISKTIKKHIPEFIALAPVIATIGGGYPMRYFNIPPKYVKLRCGYGRYMRKIKSNNWLRRHGYRMRRKAR